MARTQSVEFRGADGDSLAARLELPDGPVRAYALFAHCFSCSKDGHAATRISRRLAERGFAILRFDFTGLGGSDGDFANTNFTSNVADLEAAAAFLAAQYQAPSLLVGHSLGGAAVLVAANRIASVKAVATLGAPADTAHVMQSFAGDVSRIETEGEAEVSLGGRKFRLRKQFLDDLDGHSVEEAVRSLHQPVLIAHSPVDETVGIDNASRLFRAARHPKTYVSLDHADHLITGVEDAAYIGDVIAAWAARYAVDEAGYPPPVARQGESVIVAETGLGKFQNYVLAGDHAAYADEPESVGGQDTGPSPYQYLAAALGACTSMTLRMYAEHKSLPLERVTVQLHHEKGHADDCANCVEGQERKVDIIERTLTLEGDLTAEQRERLREIADKCPVHRTLNAPVVIRTALSKPALTEHDG
ncbi:bifunctional alpha/beta hydrolase/OsmC family protein [Maricaulis parjimensis]|uniref:bifunctional alpha/beta hydrolase/OsmC family protein n=1 Tax=Maricaulis parjimensis TaxID=144023 RepID=UPI001939D7BC|nr:bifunctional alpha/beta hydrolase/OsmC family protein [Maricaulis parjimensis]